MSRLKIGDKVCVHVGNIPYRSCQYHICSDACITGTIVADPSSSMPGVEFDCCVDGHDCDERGFLYGNCFWIRKEHIIKLEG